MMVDAGSSSRLIVGSGATILTLVLASNKRLGQDEATAVTHAALVRHNGRSCSTL